MKNEQKLNNLSKKKSKRSREYELELYYKKSGIKNNKNNKNQKKNSKKNHYDPVNKKVSKVLVNEDVVIQKEIQEDAQTFNNEEVTIVKKKKNIKLKLFKVDKKDKQSSGNKFKLCKNKTKKKSESSVKKNSSDSNIKNVNKVKDSRKIINNDLILNFENKDNKKARRKKYLKESIIFTLIFLVLDIILYFTPLKVQTLRLFDIGYLNIIVTIIILIVLLFVLSFVFNCLISELLLKFKIMKMKKLENKKENNVRKSRR